MKVAAADGVCAGCFSERLLGLCGRTSPGSCGERTQRANPEADTESFLHALDQFRIRVDRDPDQIGVLGIARSQGLSVYDAAYLELAHRQRLRLATLDRRLGEAARSIGVELL
jgi:predicted nucleic acid-binding protein